MGDELLKEINEGSIFKTVTIARDRGFINELYNVLDDKKRARKKK